MRRTKLGELSALIGSIAAVLVAAWVLGAVLLEMMDTLKTLTDALRGQA